MPDGIVPPGGDDDEASSSGEPSFSESLRRILAGKPKRLPQLQLTDWGRQEFERLAKLLSDMLYNAACVRAHGHQTKRIDGTDIHEAMKTIVGTDGHPRWTAIATDAALYFSGVLTAAAVNLITGNQAGYGISLLIASALIALYGCLFKYSYR